jgi:hypothetical protein
MLHQFPMKRRRTNPLTLFVASTVAAIIYLITARNVTAGMNILQFEGNDPTDRSTMGQKTKTKSAAKFIFFIGIEGTGHHLMRAFLKGAPAVQRLSELDIHPSLTSQLQKSLFYDTGEKTSVADADQSLWFAHCRSSPETNFTMNFDRVVGILRSINDKANDHPITVPVNTLGFGKIRKNPAGMM